MVLPRSLLRMVAVAAFAALPFLGVWPAALLLALLPLCCEALLADGERVTAALTGLALGVSAYLVLPAPVRFVAPAWCACAAASGFMPLGGMADRRGMMWTVLAAACLAALFFLLGAWYRQPVIPALAEEATRAVAARGDCAQLLYSLWRSGVLPLEATSKETAALMLGVILPQTEEQLLWALRTRIESLFETALPTACVMWAGLTGLLCALLRDTIAGHRSGMHDLPPFEGWKLSRRAALGVMGIYVASLLCQLSGADVARLTGSLLEAAFRLALGVQGASVVWWLLRTRMHFSAPASLLVLALTAALFSIALVFTGLFDQLADFRRLRPQDGDDEI